MKVYQGISASTGIARGRTFVMAKNAQRHIEKKLITQGELAAGWELFEFAQKQAAEYFTSLIDENNAEQMAIFQTYILMLNDPDFISQVKAVYEKDLVCIEAVVDEKAREVANVLLKSGDEYLMQRSEDILDVYGKVLDKLLGQPTVSFDNLPDGAVLVACSLAPSDAIVLSKHGLKALVMEEGGKNSHLSILARTYGIPLVFGIENVCNLISSEIDVIVDGIDGKVIVQADVQTMELYAQKMQSEAENQKKLAEFIDKKAQTRDNKPIQLLANVCSIDDVKTALLDGAAGIGLFRTEFLFMNKSNSLAIPLNEDAQFAVYREVLELMGDKPVTIRTLDAGGDKELDSAELRSEGEKNPLLGLRAIRLCLDRPEVFRAQLRALLRASVYGNLKIMIPLITHVEQVIQTKKLMQQVKDELTKEGIPFKDDTSFGIMIETPAAAVIADLLAEHVDFFSIGSNDLTQYTLCVDRENAAVASLFDDLHPAVLRLIQTTMDAAKKASIPVSVCGEMAARSESMLELVSFGIDSFSMVSKKISGIKEVMSRFTLTEIQEKKWKI